MKTNSSEARIGNHAFLVHRTMAETGRRLIRKPHGLTESQATQLCARLNVAVEAQNRLAAKTPYILRFNGQVQHTENGLFIEHEPVTPLIPAEMFDSQSPVATEEDLLSVSAAIVEALRVAHDSTGAAPAIHGGLCPGTIVTDANGIYKVTDFGFAPLVCELLGIDSYINLAVGPPAADDPERSASGIWEILPPDEYMRDDRICAFIDPEKYGGDDRMLGTFETGSDVIAAGFILQLIAERRHPYLDPYPNAHRVVEMSKLMPGVLPMVDRRPDLKESDNKGIQVWCELIEEMLSPQPSSRPSAATMSEKLEPHVPKIDAEEILRRQDFVLAKQWIVALEKVFDARDWNAIEEELGRRPQLSHWPDDVRAKTDEIQRALEDHRKEEALRAQIEADAENARAWVAPLREAVDAEDWDRAAQILEKKPSLAHWPEDVDAEAADLSSRIETEIANRRAREAAELWMSQLSEFVEREAWDNAADILASRPAPEHVSEEMIGEISRCEALLKKHLEATKLDHGKAAAWLNRAKTAADNKAFADALQVLDEPPQEIAHWPDDVRGAAEELKRRCIDRLADHVGDTLANRTELIESLARDFIRALIESDFKDLLEPAAIRLVIDSEQFTSDAGLDEGKARLCVEFARGDPLPETNEIGVPIAFVLDAKPPRMIQTEETRTQLLPRITESLAMLQQTRLEDWIAQLRKGLFPDAQVSAPLKKPVPKTEAILTLLDGEEHAGRIKARLKWSPTDLTWAPDDPKGFYDDALAVAVDAARDAVGDMLAAPLELLARYRPLTTVAIEPTNRSPSSTGQPPGVLEFEGRLGLRDPRSDVDSPRWTLQNFRGRSPKAGQVRLDGDFSDAEAQLFKIIAAEQNHILSSLQQDLKGLTKSAPGKVKLKASPKRIKKPIDEIAFELRASGKQPLTLSGRWSAEKLRFDLPSNWRDTAEAFCGPASKPTVPKDEPATKATKAPEKKRPAKPKKKAKASAPKKKPPSPKSAEAPPRASPDARKWRRPALIGGGALVAAVAGLLIAFGLSGEETSTPSGGDAAPPPKLAPPPPATGLIVGPIGPQQVGKPFAVEIKAVDDAGKAANVAEETAVSLRTRADGVGLSGTINGTISAGQSAIRLDGVVVDSESDGIVLVASATNRRISEVESSPFRVAAEAIPVAIDLVAKMLADLPYLQGSGNAQGLDRIFQAIIPQDRRTERTAEIELLTILSQAAIVSDHRPLGEDGVSFQVDLGIEDASARFALHLRDESWQAADRNVEPFDVIYQSVAGRTIASMKAKEKEIQSHYLAGELLSAHDKYDKLAHLLDLQALKGSDVVQQLHRIQPKLPPRWDQVALPKDAYLTGDENDLDIHLGYPRTLKTADGERTMLLVSVPPQDAVWDYVDAGDAPPAGRQWSIFYIDSSEWDGPIETIEEAEQALDQRAPDQRIPTRMEWMLAALKLYDPPVADGHDRFGFLGRQWEWCSASDNGAAWVSGGCQLLTPQINGQQNRAAGAVLDELWKWLNNPLVTQRRRYGDGLATIRPLKWIHPPVQ